MPLCCSFRIIPYQELSGSYNSVFVVRRHLMIIPYQELSGSYNQMTAMWGNSAIIPYQELSGSYNASSMELYSSVIIPYQELSGSYNAVCSLALTSVHYTIPRTVRELQPAARLRPAPAQLYHTKNCQGATTHSAGPLRPLGIIPYQELSGSYNRDKPVVFPQCIIPYQELSGSYNTFSCDDLFE